MRTEANGVELKANGRYSVKFVTYMGKPGDEYVANEVESGAVFLTEDEACAGQQRALDLLETTDRFPNMCTAF